MVVPAPPLPLDLELAPHVDEVTRVLGLIDALGSSGTLGEAAAFALRVAADEVLLNIIHHARPETGELRIRLRLELADGRARLEISDAGRPFDPLTAPPPDTRAALGERSVGGLGIHLVRQLMDEVRYERTGDRNVLTMVKQMETRDGDPGREARG